MRRYSILGALFFALFLFACNNTSSEKQDIPTEEKTSTADEKPAPAKPDKELASKLEDLLQIKNSINVQGRTLTETEIKISAAIDDLINRHANWEKQWMNAQSSGLAADQKVAMDSLAAIKQDADDLDELLENLAD